MRIRVTLKGTLADRLPGGTGEVELAEGSTLTTLSEQLDLPGRHCVFVVNGQTAKLETSLADGDKVQAFPPMAGG